MLCMFLGRIGSISMAVGNDEEKVKKIPEIAAYAVQADVCDLKAMRELGAV